MAKVREVTTHICIYHTGSDEDEGAFEIGRRQRARGALSIGYHYVVRQDGSIEIGRPFTEIGLHDKQFNRNSVAIIVACPSQPTEAQQASVDQLVAEMQRIYPTAINIVQQGTT